MPLYTLAWNLLGLSRVSGREEDSGDPLFLLVVSGREEGPGDPSLYEEGPGDPLFLYEEGPGDPSLYEDGPGDPSSLRRGAFCLLIVEICSSGRCR